jgi:DNA-binding PadR family transcriptional regulator
MVRLGAQSGYEIKQMVQRSIRFFWTISQAQIYPSLELLERAGLIRGRSEPTGNRPRRVFEITPSGDEVLKDWLARDEQIPFELRDVGLLKLFFADALPQDAARDLLASVRLRSAQRVLTLRDIEPEARSVAEQGDAFPLLTLRMGVAFHQAMVDVCNEFESEFL